jgi:hypothetical protein
MWKEIVERIIRPVNGNFRHATLCMYEKLSCPGPMARLSDCNREEQRHV